MAGDKMNSTWKNDIKLGKNESVLEMLYEAFSEQKNLVTDQIKSNFKTLYEAMNDMTMQECDQIINPVCALCREHEKNGFINGLKVGFTLYQELNTENLS